MALSRCAKVDECKSWADKAEALSSYAKQANDKTLHRLADRIQARAIRREGELLEEVVAAKTGPKPKNSGPAPAANSGRFAMGRAAGLSDRQTKTALRVAKIPQPEFEEAVESENPPTVTELAERGTKRKPLVDLGDRTPEQFQAATWLIGAVEGLQRYIEKEVDLDLAIPGAVSSLNAVPSAVPRVSVGRCAAPEAPRPPDARPQLPRSDISKWQKE